MQPTLRNKLKKLALTSIWQAFLPISISARKLYELGATLEFKKDWGTYPNPEWFNHQLDFVFFPKNRQPHFFERGVYASEVVRDKRVLDICCGDGSVAALFLSPLAKHVLGVDFDPDAIAAAQKRWAEHSNCEFRTMDIRKLDLPKGSFDVCTWDAALEHFTQVEMDQIFNSIKSLLTKDGLLHGSTIKRQDSVSHHDHEYEFDSVEELRQFLTRYFRNVSVWERVHPDRVNYYFHCSDSALQTKH